VSLSVPRSPADVGDTDGQRHDDHRSRSDNASKPALLPRLQAFHTRPGPRPRTFAP